VPVAAIRRGLRETGFVEGQNLAVEYRHADGQCERLPELATDLFRRQVAVIVAIEASTPALAATAATATVPVVFATASDATQIGLVNSLMNPQADPTSMSFATPRGIQAPGLAARTEARCKVGRLSR
jgi:putative ABC transport system substrate-binding protein